MINYPELPFIMPWHGVYAMISGIDGWWNVKDGWVESGYNASKFRVTEIMWRTLPAGGSWVIIEGKPEE